MSRRTVFIPYRPRTILNKGKRADHWFWTRYSAYPYIGCQHGCEFCYCREKKYSPYDDPHDFAHVIKVKENAADLLRSALRRTPVEAVFSGDYQPAERKFGLSRKMLEVFLEFGFPVFVLERSPLVLRDLDLLQELEKKARAFTAFSVLSTPDAPSYKQVAVMERLAPAAEKRFAAMEKLAAAGIMTGACLMPILPGISDDAATLESVVRWTADHGGQFVLAGYLTLADQQRDYFFGVLEERFPDFLGFYQQAYPPGSYAPLGGRWRDMACQVRELCEKYGIRDRMPRPIIPGEKRAVNKRVVEILAERIYALELEAALPAKTWAYRKAAWAVEDLETDIRLVYQSLGLKGLQRLEGVGPAIAREIERLLMHC
jgi:DNA repair photolyase